VLVRGDRETQISIYLARIGLPGDDESYIAGGPVALGSELSGNRVLRDHDIATFFIQTLPVTFGHYLQFLESVRASDPDRVTSLIPHAREGDALWTLTARGLEPTAALTDFGMSPETCTAIPVFGVDGHAVTSYASWWSRRTGKPYRLPTELEWEKAARGVDGRRYPWGDRFEAIFCKMMHSRAGRARPEAVGAFASDSSPYGVRDLGGGVADWCTPVASEDARIERGILLASRGGAWCDSDADCAVTARRRVPIDERSARLGFRLVRDA
jgi:serine/threonine-protein kinase